MEARKFEEKFWEVEGMVIVLRCPEDTEVGEYSFLRAAAGDTTLSELRGGRLSTLQVPFIIHNGDVEQPHGKTRLSSIRDSYKK